VGSIARKVRVGVRSRRRGVHRATPEATHVGGRG